MVILSHFKPMVENAKVAVFVAHWEKDMWRAVVERHVKCESRRFVSFRGSGVMRVVVEGWEVFNF